MLGYSSFGSARYRHPARAARWKEIRCPGPGGSAPVMAGAAVGEAATGLSWTLVM